MFAAPALPLVPPVPVVPTPTAPNSNYSLPDLPPIPAPNIPGLSNLTSGTQKLLDSLFGTPPAAAPTLPRDFKDRKFISPAPATPDSLGKLPFRGGQSVGVNYTVNYSYIYTRPGINPQSGSTAVVVVGPLSAFEVIDGPPDSSQISLKVVDRDGTRYFLTRTGKAVDPAITLTVTIISITRNDNQPDTGGNPPAVGGNPAGVGNQLTPPQVYGFGPTTAPPVPKTAPKRKPPITPRPDEKPDERIKPFPRPGTPNEKPKNPPAKPETPKEPPAKPGEKPGTPKAPPLDPPTLPPVSPPKPDTTPKRETPSKPADDPNTKPDAPTKPLDNPKIDRPETPNQRPDPVRIPPLIPSQTPQEPQQDQEKEKVGIPPALPTPPTITPGTNQPTPPTIISPPQLPPGSNPPGSSNGGQITTGNQNSGNNNNNSNNGSGPGIDEVSQQIKDLDRKIGSLTGNNVTNITNINNQGMTCQELKDCLSGNTETANIKKFKQCNLTTGEPEFETVQIQVNKGDKAAIEAIAERLANVEGQQCKECDAVALVPEWWQVRTGQRPQLVVRFQNIKEDGTIGDSKWSLSIPHYNRDQNFKPRFPNYKKGDIQGILVLDDNSKVIVNCFNITEAKRVIAAIKQYIDPNFLKNSYEKYGERKGNAFSQVQVKAIFAKYFPDGQKNTTPEWTIKLVGD